MNCLICGNETKIVTLPHHLANAYRDPRWKCYMCGVTSKKYTMKDGTENYGVSRRLNRSLWMSASFPIEERLVVFDTDRNTVNQQRKIFPVKFTDAMCFSFEEADLMWRVGLIQPEKLKNRDWAGLRRLAVML